MESLPKITVPDACSSFRVYAAFPQAWSPGILLTPRGQRYHSSHVAFSTGEGAETREEGRLFCMANPGRGSLTVPTPPPPRLPPWPSLVFLLPSSLHFPPFVVLYEDPSLFLFARCAGLHQLREQHHTPPFCNPLHNVLLLPCTRPTTGFLIVSTPFFPSEIRMGLYQLRLREGGWVS